MAFAPEFLAKVRELALADPYFFVQGVLGLDLDWYHRAALRLALEHPRSVLEMWRGGGKSMMRTTARGVMAVCRDHNTRGLILSETEAQAARLLAGIKGRIEKEGVLTQLFGNFVAARTWTKTAITIAQRTADWDEPTVLAMGVDGPMTGGHWDWIILDDIFDIKSAYSELLRERIMEVLHAKIAPCLLPGGWVAINCTRYHYDDPAGHIERELALDPQTGESFVYRLDDPGDVDSLLGAIPRTAAWKVLQIPVECRDGSSACPRLFPLDDTIGLGGQIIEGLRTKRRTNERAYREQYLAICEEIKKGARETVFKASWLKEADRVPPRERLRVYQFVDPAWTSAEVAVSRSKREREPDWFTVATMAIDTVSFRVYVLEIWRERVSPLEGLREAAKLALRWKPVLVGVERTNLQIRQAPEFYTALREAIPAPVRISTPQRNKVARVEPFALACEQDRVRFAPGVLAGVRDELVEFPFGKHDDQVDALGGAFALISRRVGNGIGRFLDQEGPAQDDGRETGFLSEAEITASRGLHARAAEDFGRSLPPR